MLRKRFLSLTCALVLCLGLLPATALAADGGTVYVGGVTLSGSTDSPAYATTDDNGTVTTVDASADKYNIKWDGSTLTLDGAKIKGGTSSESLYATVGIYAFSNSGDVSLNIALKGVNEIFESSDGIWVYSSSYNAGAVTLTIEGEGSLNASGSSSGILVQSNNGNATLTIQNAEVTATSTVGVGVQVRSGAQKSASLTVDGGSLTATGMSEYGAGIRYTFGSSSFGSGKPSLTVSGNTIVRANGGIANNSSNSIQYGTGNEENGGIVFDGKNGTVYGSATLQENLTIGEGESLKLDNGASLNAGDHNVIVDGGTLDEGLAKSLDDSVIYKVTKVELNKTSLTLNVGDEETLIPTITPDNATDKSVTWESSDTNIATVDTNGVVTAVAPGTATITVTTVDGGYKDTCPVTVTAAPVPVTGVSLNKDSTSLTVGGTETLTATVKPEDATNKAVTWTSSNSTVATVDQNGVVTALARGTAVITATAADGRGASASCTVTVSSYLPPANPNYRITVEATQGGTVTADPTAAKAGTTVTLTPDPDAGYQVGSVAVTDRFGEPVAVTEQADGTYTFTMPNGQVTVTVTFEETPLPFTDVTEGDWFYDAVRYAYETGLMDGVGDSLFAPNSDTTRAQLVTILYRLEGQPAPSGDSGFSDVAAGTWYTDAVAWAAANGIVNGTTDTTFAPGEDITREQLVTVLYRYAESKGYDVSASADLSGYPDAGQVQDYAQPAMAWAVAEGIVEGVDGNLNPAGNATRAQIATILMRFCETVAK